MKKFILALMLVCTGIVNAAEVTVMNENFLGIGSSLAIVDARFQIDQTTGEGFVKVTVTQESPGRGGWYDQYGRWYPNRMPIPVVVFQETAKIDGLTLVGDQVIYQGTEGDVDCGKMGVSRVFKKPTFYLNGNCKLSGSIKYTSTSSNVVIVLKTK
jgi:hypothetical protein